THSANRLRARRNRRPGGEAAVEEVEGGAERAIDGARFAGWVTRVLARVSGGLWRRRLVGEMKREQLVGLHAEERQRDGLFRWFAKRVAVDAAIAVHFAFQHEPAGTALQREHRRALLVLRA